MRVEDLKAYELVERRTIADLNSEGYILRHKKTGARVALLSNDDENKVFYVGFRTPPVDSTGVPHIIEHSVLCGSREFPTKDPFVELVKGSLNTFLNAFTYPDKTMYPVASCNDKDFQNLMHVYLDAVFYPNIYRNENIFLQEGWHYELEKPEDALTINGVVYNEMKGAFSSPDDVFDRELMNSLYPDTAYGVESGGDPDVIPELTYEGFLDFHRKYYHPSNSYIYLYGNMDMAEKLAFIDEHYLSAFDALEVDSRIAMQEPFAQVNHVVKEYPIGEDEEESEGTYLSWNVAVGNNLDRELYVAFQILDYALCSAPGAPLKQALIDQGIGKDVYSSYANYIMQPYFSIVAKNAEREDEEKFLNTVHDMLTKLAKEGLDKKALLAAINYFEFRYREADYGSEPKGLIYGMHMLDSWLYDDTKPFIHIEANDTYEKMRAYVEQGYFEELIDKYLLGNSHCSVVVLYPKKGLGAEKEKAFREQMAAKKAALSEAEIQTIIDRVHALREYQEKPDTKEDIEKLPMLTREDVKRETVDFVNEEVMLGDTKLLLHDLFTSGIGYLRLIFSVENVPESHFPYLGILRSCLGSLNTANYSYGDLFNEINIQTGGITPATNIYRRVEDASAYQVTFDLATKVLCDKIPKAFTLMEEMLFTSDYSDEKRLKEILAEGLSRMQSHMSYAGHSVAAGRALSYIGASGVVSELLSGIELYRLYDRLEKNFEAEKAKLIQKLTELAQMIFRPENLMVDFTGTKEALEQVKEPLAQLVQKLYTCPVEKGRYLPVPEKKNEAYKTSGQVQYVCRAGNYSKEGLVYTGALRALKVMMGYGYLWENVRVKGGAYGCMCNFGRTGDCYFVSYRDPHLDKTIQVYENAAQVVENFEADERTMTQYIIGAVSDLDMPLNPSAKGRMSLNAYMSGLTKQMMQQERDELLDAVPQDIRALSAYIRAFMGEEALCVVGNAQKIDSVKELFGKVENLL